MSGYEFHANALGVGGALTFGGRRTTIPSAASAVLSPAGGEGYAVSENYDANGVSYSRAESRVVGAEIGAGIFYTYADVLITNLTVFDALNIPRLRIASMGAQMTSTRSPGMSESQFEVRLSYRGIHVDGADHEAIVDLKLCNAATFEDATEVIEGDVPGFASSFGVGEPVLETALANVDTTQTLNGALVRHFCAPDGTVIRTGCSLPVPNVGQAHFGEFIFKPGDRKVKLFRLQVGPGNGSVPVFFAAGAGEAEAFGGDGGVVVLGALEGNGSPPTGG